MIIATLALLIFGIAYAVVVRTLRRRNPQHGYTPWLVVIGVGAVVAVYTLLAGLEAGVALFLLFAAAGLPMVAEFMDDHTAGRIGGRIGGRKDLEL